MGEKTRQCAGISATGNWYIDAGIVGFLRYLYEDLNYSREEIEKLVNGEICINERVLSDFGLALWLDKLYYKPNKKEEDENRTSWNSFKNELIEEWKNKDENNRNLDALRCFLKEKFCGNTKFKIPDKVRLRPGMLFNFKFFNVSKLKKCVMFDDFYNYMTNKEKVNEEQIFDKTINKFLPSAAEFPNEFMRSIPLNELENHIPYFKVFLLSFEKAFVKIEQRWYFFHSPDIMDSFKENVDLAFKENVDLARNKSRNKSGNDNFVNAVITESKWINDNWQVIIHSGFDNRNQEIRGVKFLPLDVATAKILKSNNFKERPYVLLKEFPVAEEPNYKVYTNALELLVEHKPLSAFMISFMLRAVNDDDFKKEFDKSYYDGIYWATAEILHSLQESDIESKSDEIFNKIKRAEVALTKLLETSKYDQDTAKKYFLSLAEAAIKNNVYEFKFIILKLLQNVIDSTAEADKKGIRKHVTRLLDYINQIENKFQPKTVPILISLYKMLE